jgi:membrane-bound lytic murein transglycosylase D
VQELNPHILRGVTPPDRPYVVRIPPGTRDTFLVRYAQIPPEERVSWLTHVVSRGETMGAIARRYGVSMAAVQAANPGVHPRRLRVGQTLIIPRAGVPPAELAAAARPAPAPRNPSVHVVRRGETLWEISRRYGVSIAELMEWNGLESRTIRPGQRLRVRPPAVASEGTGGDGGRVITHRVQRGDTIWGIAQKYSVRPEDLLRWNRLDRNAVIRPGDEVKIFLP